MPKETLSPTRGPQVLGLGDSQETCHCDPGLPDADWGWWVGMKEPGGCRDVCVYYYSTYYKAVRVCGGGNNGMRPEVDMHAGNKATCWLRR